MFVFLRDFFLGPVAVCGLVAVWIDMLRNHRKETPGAQRARLRRDQFLATMRRTVPSAYWPRFEALGDQHNWHWSMVVEHAKNLREQGNQWRG